MPRKVKGLDKRNLTVRWDENFDEIMEALAEEAGNRLYNLPDFLKYLARAWYNAKINDDFTYYLELVNLHEVLVQRQQTEETPVKAVNSSDASNPSKEVVQEKPKKKLAGLDLTGMHEMAMIKRK